VRVGRWQLHLTTPAPVALPVAIVTAAGYLVTVGSVVAAVSQLTVHQEPMDAEERF
jgi:hypothetical protein